MRNFVKSIGRALMWKPRTRRNRIIAFILTVVVIASGFVIYDNHKKANALTPVQISGPDAVFRRCPVYKRYWTVIYWDCDIMWTPKAAHETDVRLHRYQAHIAVAAVAAASGACAATGVGTAIAAMCGAAGGALVTKITAVFDQADAHSQCVDLHFTILPMYPLPSRVRLYARGPDTWCNFGAGAGGGGGGGGSW